MRILALIDAYLPGFRYGGPVQSLANMIQQMPTDCDFWVYTRDRDRGVTSPYSGIEPDSWGRLGRAHVYYGSPGTESLSTLRRVAQEVRPDVIYLNSLFARNSIRTVLATWAGLLTKPVVIAPRGETAPAALSIKPRRKSAYLRLARRLGVFKKVVWQASSEREAQDIQTFFGLGGKVVVAPNIVVAPDLVPASRSPSSSLRRPKEPGRARFVFISRIARMKNLASAIRWLGKLKGEVSLDVFGTQDDAAYWEECEKVAREVAPSMRIEYRGSLAPADVIPTFARFDFFVFPTLGENFGHVIFESLIAGTPVVISDRTPWTPGKAGAGWAIPLSDEARWVAALQDCVDMDEERHRILCAGASTLAGMAPGQADALERNVELFRIAAAKAT